MYGFSYNGKHSSDFHCYFVPNETDRWFASPDFEVYETTDAGKDGGYFYGTRAKIRTFEQRCYFEDITIETREAMRRWLDRSTSGKLIFDERPFVYYDVHPTKTVQGKQYNHRIINGADMLYSGTFTITFAAYIPYGYLIDKDYTGLDFTGASRYCGMVEHGMMPEPPTAESRNFLLYNCGTQVCDTLIRISAPADTQLTISNNTNGSFCTFNSFPSTGYLEVDSRYGSVTWVHGDERELAFKYHVSGFLTLDPYIAHEGDVIVSYTSGSPISQQPNAIYEPEDKDKYVHLDGEWIKIVNVTVNGYGVLDKYMDHSGIETTKIVTMNEIEIIGSNNLTLTRFEIDYFPKIV